MAFPANMTVGQIRELVENPGMPIRQPAVSLFTVDTADRIRYNSDGERTDATPLNNIYINKQQTLMNGYITRISLTEINIPWANTNVNARNNSMTMSLTEPSVNSTITVTVPADFYTPNELADALEAALNAKIDEEDWEAIYDFTVTYNDRSATFTIENTIGGDGSFFISGGAADEDLRYMMGFAAIPVASLPSVGYDTITGGYASMLSTPYFDIVSSQLTKQQNINDNSTSTVTGSALLARVYLMADGVVPRPIDNEELIIGCRPFTIHKEFQNPKQIYWDTKEFISVVDLQLIDYKGNVLYEAPITVDDGVVTLGNGGNNYQLTLQITET